MYRHSRVMPRLPPGTEGRSRATESREFASESRFRNLSLTVGIAIAALGSIIAIQPTMRAELYLSLVDESSGDVLWANATQTSGDFEGD